MLINKPTYYDDFKCIADKCPDTCCAMWQVVIDSKTADFYNSVNTDFGDYISSVMYVDDENDTVFKNINGKCPFLNDCNLCDIYINLGESHLSQVCASYPRFTNTFGGTRECGLILSCPVANDFILNDKEFAFVQDFTDELPDINNLDADEFLRIKSIRNTALNFVKENKDNPKVAINSIFQLLNLEISLEEFLSNTVSVLNDLEYISEENKELFTSLTFNQDVKLTLKHSNILFYYIYRYCLISVYDNDITETMLFSVFSVCIISLLDVNLNNLSLSSKAYSREIEHSGYNIDSVKQRINKYLLNN